MRDVSAEEMKSVLDAAVVGRLCVQAIPADYEMLYLGFGDKVALSPGFVELSNGQTKRISQLQPPYEFQTCYSHWWIEKQDEFIGDSENTLSDELTASSMIGVRATGWKFLKSSWGLRIDFENQLTWQLLPYAHLRGEDVWRLLDPNGVVWILKNDGRMLRKNRNESD